MTAGGGRAEGRPASVTALPVPVTALPVTATAAVNALGTDTRSVLQRLDAGESGLAPVESLPFTTECGAIRGALPAPPRHLRSRDCRNNRIALLALEEITEAVARACSRWGADRVGLCLGSSTAGMSNTEAAFAFHAREGRLPDGYDWEQQTSLDALLAFVRGLTGIRGPAVAVSTACSSSGKVFGNARRWIRSGAVDAVLVGGVDCLCELTLRGFLSLAVLSPERARPFSAARRGINIGEGAAFALVERDGEGPLLLGVGETADAHHMSAPHPEGLGAHAAMEAALAQAGVDPGEVDHVNAHGTGTPQNDSMEARAIARLFGESPPPVVSTKGYTGHLLGAAGATEAVFALHAIETGWIPASLGCEPPDPELPVHPSAQPEQHRVRSVLSNSFAFGGSNVSVLFGASR